MKKITAFILCFAILFISTFSVGAVGLSDSIAAANVVAEKRALRDACIAKGTSLKLKEMDKDELSEKRQEVFNSLFSGETDIDTAVDELEELGLYPLESSVDAYKKYQAEQNMNRSSSTSLLYNNVIVSYDSTDGTWVLGGGVWWGNDSWVYDIPYMLFPSIGASYTVGGQDGVGIALYDLSGSYSNCWLVDTWLYVSAGNGYLATTSHSPTGNFDARYGVFHEFQDYALLIDFNYLTAQSTYLYYGQHMSVFAKYSSEFVNFHGRARLNYAHTWNNSSISSVGVNVDASGTAFSGGFNISFANNQYGFQTISPGETLF